MEPILQSVKPPLFKDISFSRLRFGDVPFRIEGERIEVICQRVRRCVIYTGVEIYDITKTEMVLDIDIRWCGDANVTLTIEPNIPSMTSLTCGSDACSIVGCVL